MPFSNRSWGKFDSTDYKDAESYCAACLIDLNPEGEKKVKDKCKLPVKEPNGTYNRNALIAAAAALAGARGGVDAPVEEKRKAARKLIRLYREANMTPPESLKKLAGY